MRRGFPLWLPSLFCLGLAGCAGWPFEAARTEPGGTSPAAVGERSAAEPYTVITSQTSFFSFGPSQTQGPDFALPKGALLTLLRREPGFSWVRTASGQEGYVATDQIAPVPVETVSAREPGEKARAASAKPQKQEKRGGKRGKPGSPEQIKVVPLEQMFEPPALPAH